MITGCWEAYKIFRRMEELYSNAPEHPITLWNHSRKFITATATSTTCSFAWILLWISCSVAIAPSRPALSNRTFYDGKSSALLLCYTLVICGYEH